MNHLHLAIERLPRALSVLNSAGLHWLSLADKEHALILSRQFLSALPVTQDAALICAADEQAPLLATLEPEAGPARLTLFQLAPGRKGVSIKKLRHELARLTPLPKLMLLLLPAPQLQAVTDNLSSWALELEAWLSERQAVMLVLCYGAGPQLPRELAGRLSGLVRIDVSQTECEYQVLGWRNSLGWQAGQQQELALHQGRFVVPESHWLAQDLDGDHEGCLVESAALLDMPLPGGPWRLLMRSENFWQQLAMAQERTKVLAVANNGEVVELARQLHRLRSLRGSRLIIVVRELTPCLRQADQQLLLQCGVNLIIPAHTPHAHFILLINCLQGQRWHRPLLAEPEALLRQLYPPRARGLQTPTDFFRLIEETLQSGGAATARQLLALPIRPQLTVEQCVGQLQLRREGDLACVVEGHCYLFLFACQDDGVDAALRNICRLPWQQLFTERRVLKGLEDLPRAGFITSTEVTMENLTSHATTATATDFRPRLVTLTCKEITP